MTAPRARPAPPARNRLRYNGHRRPTGARPLILLLALVAVGVHADQRWWAGRAEVAPTDLARRRGRVARCVAESVVDGVGQGRGAVVLQRARGRPVQHARCVSNSNSKN